MAGSLNHIIHSDTGDFTMHKIENMGDAHEALEECYHIIKIMSYGHKDVINVFCRKLGYPEIEQDMAS